MIVASPFGHGNVPQMPTIYEIYPHFARLVAVSPQGKGSDAAVFGHAAGEEKRLNAFKQSASALCERKNM